jgi:hypothetical protein
MKIASLAPLDRNDGNNEIDPLLGGAWGGLNEIASLTSFDRNDGNY